MDGGLNARRWRGDCQRMDGPGGSERDTETGRSAALLELRGRDSQLLSTFFQEVVREEGEKGLKRHSM